MKKYVLTVVGLTVLISASVLVPAQAMTPPGAGTAFVTGNGVASPGLPDPLTPTSVTWSTDLLMTGSATGGTVGRSGVGGTYGSCSFSVSESALAMGSLSGDCSGLSIRDCNMVWARTGFEGHAYGTCVVMGSPTGMVLELDMFPTTIRPVDSYSFTATFAPAGLAVI